MLFQTIQYKRLSSLRRGHANLLCIVPILTDDPRRESILIPAGKRSSHEALICVALAFEVFHCLRNAHLDLIRASQANRSYEELHRKMRAVSAAAERQLSD